MERGRQLAAARAVDTTEISSKTTAFNALSPLIIMKAKERERDGERENSSSGH